MADPIEICDTCTHIELYRTNPELFVEALGRFAAAGFSCSGPHTDIGENPFTPTPRTRKMCGLDYELMKALQQAGYRDTPTDTEARQQFFEGTLDVSPLDS